MDINQALYLLHTLFAMLVAFLFFRYLYWGIVARQYYWKGRKKVTLSCLDQEKLPFFSILVPARDEALVIANTIEHLAQLNYPKDSYEVLVITDEKELRKSKNIPNQITTQSVVKQKIQEFKKRKNVPHLKHIVVPYDFDGRLGGVCLGREVPSTKARALNYGLAYISDKTDICSFYDAESRPEKDVLLYLAHRYLASGRKQKAWQGPVFQVRNYYQLRPINKVIALFQALSHEWYLPILMRDLPFLGGTNLHMEKNLLLKVGGYDPQALSEDLELGVRTYLESGEWPEYLPMVSTEQTPATYKAYFRQRLRWGSGHLQVYDKIRNATHYDESIRLLILKNLFWKGHGQWCFYQLMVIIPFIFLALTWMGQIDPVNFRFNLHAWLKIMAPIPFSFVFYLFYRFRNYIDFSLVPSGKSKYLPVLQMVIVPVVGFFMVLPFTCALILRALNKQPREWVKTPRTQEIKAKA